MQCIAGKSILTGGRPVFNASPKVVSMWRYQAWYCGRSGPVAALPRNARSTTENRVSPLPRVLRGSTATKPSTSKSRRFALEWQNPSGKQPMFRDRPLTCLFIVATICVDLVLMTIESDRGLLLSLKAGLVLGQLAALAIWSVRGQQNRLARMSCLILTTGLLTYLIDTQSEKSLWMAFNAGYVCWTIFVTLVGDMIRYRLREKSSDKNSTNPWRVPLIEFFGWTTVVAIISFGARHMDIDFLREGDNLRIFIAVLAVPTCMTLFARRDLYDLLAFKAIALALVIAMTVVYLAKTEGKGKDVVIFQSVYLVMCLPILGMDEVRSHAKNARTEKPQLFNPQD